MAMLTLPASIIAITTSVLVAPSSRRRPGPGAHPAESVPGQCRMQIHHMRHDGGTEHRGRQQHRVQPVEPGNQPGGNIGGRRRRDEQTGQEADRDDHQEPGDQPLEGPLAAAVLHSEQGQRDHTGDQPAQQQRQVEQQVQRDGTADHLGQIGRHGHRLGLQPVADPGRPAQPADRPVPAGTPRWPGRAWPTGIARHRPMRSPPPAPRPAGSRTWRRPAGWPRHCRGRRRRPPRRKPGRAGRPEPPSRRNLCRMPPLASRSAAPSTGFTTPCSFIGDGTSREGAQWAGKAQSR